MTDIVQGGPLGGFTTLHEVWSTRYRDPEKGELVNAVYQLAQEAATIRFGETFENVNISQHPVAAALIAILNYIDDLEVVSLSHTAIMLTDLQWSRSLRFCWDGNRESLNFFLTSFNQPTYQRYINIRRQEVAGELCWIAEQYQLPTGEA
ncbi:MAG: hypothetical protein QY318_01590 [Candidatus Dojkabacteria bacterium]|nr:MAG: hypothetical protein QY318_01590 [Candidatus Dojkabacteria bacterium]